MGQPPVGVGSIENWDCVAYSTEGEISLHRDGEESVILH